MDNDEQNVHTNVMDVAAMQHGLICQLQECLALRRIALGQDVLRQNADIIVDSVQPERAGSAILLGCLAQWVDLGFSSVVHLESLLRRFPPESRIQIPVIDYVHLRLVEGFLALAREDYDTATSHFRFITSVQEELPDKQLIAVANFWTARALSRAGRYEEALAYTAKGQEIATELGYMKMAAIMRMAESWVLFQRGKTNEALRGFENAAEELSTTDDHVARGNIESAYGRIARRHGRFDRALRHFNCAMEEYRRHDPQHPNVARTLVNLATVKRLIGVQIQRRLDEAIARRKSEKGEFQISALALQERARLQALRNEAQAELGEAEAIYSPPDNHHGRGSVLVMRGFLHLDMGELAGALEEAGKAYHVGQEKGDNILMARARILQCIAENTQFEEGIEENGGPAVHAQPACDFARDAVELARKTDNRRLLARAYVWQGLVWANRFFDNIEAARKCCDEATSLLKPDGQDYIWDDLQQLKVRILARTGVDTILREWSQGFVGEKSFQQVSEEFAAIVIPRVWEREFRKVSRVAAKLSVSPKKVRRALQAAGIIDKKREPMKDEPHLSR
jgi:tetratricopeptide (TPR) repeat protein